MADLLEYDHGDLRVRLERKITFADQSDDGSEASALISDKI